LYNTAYHIKDLSKYSFLVTGGAGFIGSNLVEYLLRFSAKKVVILDDFSTGYKENIFSFLEDERCVLIKGDIRNPVICRRAVLGIDYIFHQAALGSVPRSIKDPISTNEVNVSGFLNMLIAAKDSNSVKRIIYAASSSTYGDHNVLPKVEDKIGKPLSPYAVTKFVNELYADVFQKTYGIECIGLRYFNVFGPRQSPNGAYAAVIPLFINGAIRNEPVRINGDGEQTRDFTFIENVVQANMKAIFIKIKSHQVYNIACGKKISINELWSTIKHLTNSGVNAVHQKDRIGDIKDSLANINKAKEELMYAPKFFLNEGLKLTLKSYK